MGVDNVVQVKWFISLVAVDGPHISITQRLFTFTHNRFPPNAVIYCLSTSLLFFHLFSINTHFNPASVPESKMENGDNFQESKAKYDCLLFGKTFKPFFLTLLIRLSFNLLLLFSDLDDTLYPLSSGLSAHVTKNIQGNHFT